MKHLALYRNKGQSLLEYVLTGATIAVVAIGGILLVSGNLNNRLGGLKSDFDNHVQTASASNQQVASTPSSLAGTQSLIITLKNGQQINISSYPADLSSSIQTLGTNGYTGLLADNLSSLTDQLLDAEQLTPDQANILLALANQGHQIAQIENLIEQAAQQAGTDTATFQNAQIQFNGATYTPETLAMAHLNAAGIDYIAGHDRANYSTWKSLQDYSTNRNTGISLTEFIHLYDTAKANGSLSDPVINLLVSTMSLQIAQASDAMTNQLHMDTYSDPSQLNNAITSNLSHSDSSVICTSGSGKDSGIKCKK